MTKQAYKLAPINEYIQEMLKELQEMADDHFGNQAETENWKDVNELIEIGHRIRNALDKAKDICNK